VSRVASGNPEPSGDRVEREPLADERERLEDQRHRVSHERGFVPEPVGSSAQSDEHDTIEAVGE
jgi:hypothetical protein